MNTMFTRKQKQSAFGTWPVSLSAGLLRVMRHYMYSAFSHLNHIALLT